MKTTIPNYPIQNYSNTSPDGYKLKVIKTPEALITFRKKFYSENIVFGSRIYFGTDELCRHYVIKEYRLTGSKQFKKALGWWLPGGKLNTLRIKSLAAIEKDFAAVEKLGRAFGPRGYSLNKSAPNLSTKCYAFQRVLKDNLPNLLKEMIRVTPFRFDVTRLVALDVAQDVAFLHSRDYMHLDIKPENICLQGNRFQLIDFDTGGFGETVTVRGSTAEYAPPEMDIDGPVAKSADIYSLGVLFFELVQPPGSRLLGWHKFDHMGSTIKTETVLRQYTQYRSNNMVNTSPEIREHFRSFDEVLDATNFQYARLVRSMMSVDEDLRPTIAEVVCALRSPRMAVENPNSERLLRAHLDRVPDHSNFFCEEMEALRSAIDNARAADPIHFWQRRS